MGLPMTSVLGKFGAIRERNLPLVVGIIACVCTYLFCHHAFTYLLEREMSYQNIYSAVFDVSAIFTAFLLTFFTFVITTERGFIARSRGTRPYAMLLVFTRRAMALGLVLTIFSIPMMVVEPAPTDQAAPATIAVAIWVGWTTWTSAAFLRAANLFLIFAKEHS